MSETVDNVIENVQDSVNESNDNEIIVEDVSEESDVEEEEEPVPDEPEPVPDEPDEPEPVPDEPDEPEPVPDEPEPVPDEPVPNEPEPEPEPEPELSDGLSDGLSDEYKLKIAELDFLRECCGEWVGKSRRGKRNFLNSWNNKNVTIDSSIDYESVLNHLEKLPELIKLWVEGGVKTDSNHFKNIESYNLEKTLFGEKNIQEKIELLEQLIGLLIDCASNKMKIQDIEDCIENLY